MRDDSPFHVGERRVQSMLGVREEIEPWARRVVRPYLPEEHRAFYQQLPFLVVAARDSKGRPWATLVSGEPGFVSSSTPATLAVAARPSRGDALFGQLAVGSDVGVLGIEPHTRRRNRVNGSVSSSDGASFELAVGQAFGNCPQYITEREWCSTDEHSKDSTGVRGTSLSAAQMARIGRSDTFFVASGYRDPSSETASHGMDASHRGGVPGFVRVVDERHIVFPDYAGNNLYNTIGNLVMDARIGIVFVDFKRGDLLQITGRAEIDWDSDQVARVPGARRLVGVEIDEVVEVQGALPLRWATPGNRTHALRVVAVERESADVASFYLEDRAGDELPRYSAGQYLPIELEIPGHPAGVARTYSLSGNPTDRLYRISVKRHPHGLVSRRLHDRLEVGGLVSTGRPQGDFVLDHSHDETIVLLGAGVGVTPLLGMLHELVGAGDRRPILFVHGTRDGDHHPFRAEVEALAAQSPNLRVHVAYSRPRSSDLLGTDYDSAGRVDGTLLSELLDDIDGDYYVCGPLGFMETIRRELEARGVAPERVHSESFGPQG